MYQYHSTRLGILKLLCENESLYRCRYRRSQKWETRWVISRVRRCLEPSPSREKVRCMRTGREVRLRMSRRNSDAKEGTRVLGGLSSVSMGAVKKEKKKAWLTVHTNVGVDVSKVIV